MGKKALIALIFIVLLSFTITYGDGVEDIINSQVDMISLEDLQQYIDRINWEMNGPILELSINSLIKEFIKGRSSFNLKKLFGGIWNYSIKEVLYNVDLLFKIIVLAIFCGLFQNLHNGFQNESVAKFAYTTCYALIIILAINSFTLVSKICIETIDYLVTFMQSLLPILITLLLSIGGITSSSLFQPIIYTSITTVSTFIKTIIIPLVIFSAILSIISNFSERIRVTRLASLIKGVAIGLLGIILTIFTGIISIQGLTSSSIDGVMAKTTKFAVDSFIPIIGDFLSEAFDAVVSCSLVIKNGISMLGLFIILLLNLFPIIKILVIYMTYKLSSALIEPIVQNELVDILNDISNSIFILLCCLMAVSIQFFIAISVVMGVGNLTIMMR